MARLNLNISDKAEMRCNECGKAFTRFIKSSTVDVRCPGCGGYDTEIA